MWRALRIPFMGVMTVGLLAFLSIPQATLDEARDRFAAVDIEGLSRLSPAAGGDSAVSLTPHKAVYSFRMVSVQSNAHISDIRGQMYYEQDDACDAITSDQRFTTEYHYAERSPNITTSHYSAWEAKNGSTFHYISDRQENAQTTEQLRGVVVRADKGISKAEYSRPADLSFELPEGYLLPMSHTIEVIRRAKAGEKIYNAIVFDGTDEDGPVEINTFIGHKASQEEIEGFIKTAGKDAAVLLSPDAWHIRMAVYPLKEEMDMVPVYEMDILLHDNGVISKTLVDYKTFKVGQTLDAIETLPVKSCP